MCCLKHAMLSGGRSGGGAGLVGKPGSRHLWYLQLLPSWTALDGPGRPWTALDGSGRPWTALDGPGRPWTAGGGGFVKAENISRHVNHVQVAKNSPHSFCSWTHVTGTTGHPISNKHLFMNRPWAALDSPGHWRCLGSAFPGITN